MRMRLSQLSVTDQSLSSFAPSLKAHLSTLSKPCVAAAFSAAGMAARFFLSLWDSLVEGVMEGPDPRNKWARDLRFRLRRELERELAKPVGERDEALVRRLQLRSLQKNKSYFQVRNPTHRLQSRLGRRRVAAVLWRFDPPTMATCRAWRICTRTVQIGMSGAG